VDRDTAFGDAEARTIVTTVGRVFFNEVWPPEMGFINKTVNKSVLGDLIWHCHKRAGHAATVVALDKLKKTGFEQATLAGVSVGMVDMIIPREKSQILQEARDAVKQVRDQYRQGVITDGERYNKIVDIWTHATEEISNAMYTAIDENEGSHEINPVYMMVDSKARGSSQQIRQLAGMRGLMAKPSGEIIERPITANFREGLSVLEYFISTHGARKGLADTALKTADAGYLTRKLVDVSQDVIIMEPDCGTVNGIDVMAITEGDEDLVGIDKRLIGRNALNDIHHPLTGAVLVAANQEIDEVRAKCDQGERIGSRTHSQRSDV
jgi:DNA-directed RNA polymerase subunit beta'